MLDLTRLEEASQERRDVARKTAVQAIELRHTQELVDTYIEASSGNDDDDDHVHTATLDPADVYRTSIEYSRRMDLIDAFEKAGQREPGESHINIVV